MNEPRFTVNEIAGLVAGQLESGNGDAIITGVASLAEAQPGDLSFFGNPKYAAELKESQAGAILVRPGVEFTFSGAAIAVENPSMAFGSIMTHFIPAAAEVPAGIHPTAIIGENCEIAPSSSIQARAILEDGVKVGAGTVISAGCFIGRNSRLGENCLIYPGVVIRDRTQIGRRVIIHSGAVIGSDGFGYEMVEGRHRKIPQIGIVQLDDDVEIGANTTIDRARFGRTWIGEGTKIDNLVQIAHNVVIGRHSVIIAQAGISGSTRIGDYVIIAGQAGIVGHLKIGDRAVIAAKAGISKNVPADAKWMGYFAEPAKDMAEKMAYLSRLPKLFSRVKTLEEKSPS